MNKILSCVIIDDEPLAQDLLEKFVNRIPYLSLAARFDNAIDAISQLDKLKPDIIFLDINMPEMTGIEFLRSFSQKRPHIILTTAYSQYAIDGFEYDVVDYLLKPIPFDRFMKAINKVKDRQKDAEIEQTSDKAKPQTQASASPTQEAATNNNFILVKEDKKLIRISFEEIVFVEAMRDYIKIHTKQKEIITHMTMAKIEQALNSTLFLRINRSFIMNIDCIRAIDGNTIETTNHKKLPIGINYKDAVKEALHSKMV